MKKLRNILISSLVSLSAVTMPVLGAGITPMLDEGFTPSDKKAFRLTVVNPYKSTIDYKVELFEPDLKTPAKLARINRENLRVPGRKSRKLLLILGIPKGKKEREVAVCIHSPSKTGAVLARVCGRYTGKRYR